LKTDFASKAIGSELDKKKGHTQINLEKLPL
jgi:hypothetical protein